MATHLPLLSYHVDTSNWIFQEAQDVGFTKMYGRNCHPEWYQYPNFQGLVHGLNGVSVKLLGWMFSILQLLKTGPLSGIISSSRGMPL